MSCFASGSRVVAVALAMCSVASGDSSECELSIATGSKDSASLFQHKTIIKRPLPDLSGETAPQFFDELVLTKSGVFGSTSTAFWLTIALNVVVCGLIARAWYGRSQDEYGGPVKTKVLSAQPAVEVSAVAPPKVVLNDVSDVLELAHAIRSGDAAQCEELLQRNKALVNMEDHCGCSALHVAADCGSAPLTRTLMNFGASVNAQDSWEETPLHFAARAGSADTCEVLLAHRAELDPRNSDEATPLLLAAQKGQVEVCELLLSRGAGVAGLCDDKLPPVLSALLFRRMFESAGGH